MGDTVGIIPAAGNGKRLGATSPKALIDLGKRKLIDFAIDNLLEAGIVNITIVIKPDKGIHDAFLSYINSVYNTDNIQFTLITQRQPWGIAHAVNRALEVTYNEVELFYPKYALVHLGDEINMQLGDGIPLGKALLELVKSGTANIAEGYIDESDPDVIKRTNEIRVGYDGVIEDIAEKPEAPRTEERGIGFYAINTKAFYEQYFTMEPSATRNEKEITDIVWRNALSGMAYARYLDGWSININTQADLDKAKERLKC